MRPIRPAHLCRSWLFLEGANEAVLRGASASGADVLIQELEDFTPPASRPRRGCSQRICTGRGAKQAPWRRCASIRSSRMAWTILHL